MLPVERDVCGPDAARLRATTPRQTGTLGGSGRGLSPAHFGSLSAVPYATAHQVGGKFARAAIAAAIPTGTIMDIRSGSGVSSPMRCRCDGGIHRRQQTAELLSHDPQGAQSRSLNLLHRPGTGVNAAGSMQETTVRELLLPAKLCILASGRLSGDPKDGPGYVVRATPIGKTADVWRDCRGVGMGRSGWLTLRITGCQTRRRGGRVEGGVYVGGEGDKGARG